MTVVYVDLVGDLFHAGHVELLRAARSRGDRLVVGVLGADDVAEYKRRPVMTLDERVAVVASCRYVDEVVAPAPMRLDDDFIESHAITVVVHGDDPDLGGCRRRLRPPRRGVARPGAAHHGPVDDGRHRAGAAASRVRVVTWTWVGAARR